MNTVLHLERKFTSPTETFIVNQVNSISQFDVIVGTIINLNNLATHRSVIVPSEKNILSKRARFLSIKTADDLKKELDATGKTIDLIHTHYLVDAAFFRNFTKHYSVPKICSAYGYDISSFPKRYFGLARLILTPLFHEYDYFIAMSNDMKQDYIRLGCPEKKIIVHYYGTDTKKFYNESRTYAINDRPIKILSVGTLEEKKAQHLVVDALHLLRENYNYSNYEYHIVGSGDYESLIKKKAERYKLQDKVIVHGFVPHDDDRLIHLFREADIFILPSITTRKYDKEGIPGTLIEAMANGLPVISTYHAGIPEVIEDGKDGLLTKERDIEAMALALYKLVTDSSLRENLGRSAQQRAIQQLDLTTRTKNLERIYQDILNRKK